MAVTLLHSGVNLGTFSQSVVSCPRVAELANRVRVVSAEEFTRAFPAKRGARVVVILRDGRRVSASVPDRFGSPGNPIPDAHLERKFADLIALRGGPVESTLSVIHNVRHAPDVAELSF